MVADDAYAGPSGLPHDGPLRTALTAYAASGLSGVLRVTGDPGGVIHLDGGGVAAIQTPGAPSAEVILLRSGRVSDTGWDAAFASSAANSRSMSAELVADAVVGAGELEAVLWTALADAMFVLASGHVEECEPQPGQVDCLLPLTPAADADLLLAEAARRVRVLATTDGIAGWHLDRFIAVPVAKRPGKQHPGGRDEIVALADGRRTPRDIAFASGHGVYATVLELARLREAGVLTVVPSGPASARRELTSPAPEQADAPVELPRRSRGMPVLPRRTVDNRTATGRAAPHRLLGPRSGGNASPPGTE